MCNRAGCMYPQLAEGQPYPMTTDTTPGTLREALEWTAYLVYGPRYGFDRPADGPPLTPDDVRAALAASPATGGGLREAALKLADEAQKVINTEYREDISFEALHRASVKVHRLATTPDTEEKS